MNNRNIGFRDQFVAKVANGEKTQTIRKIGANGTARFKVGDECYLFEKYRTKHANQIGRGVIVGVAKIRIKRGHPHGYKIVERQGEIVETDENGNNIMAQLDGFDSVDAFLKYFEADTKQHDKNGEWIGYLYRWNFHPAKTPKLNWQFKPAHEVA